MTRILCPKPDSFSPEGLAFAAAQAELTAETLSQAEFDRLAPEYDAVLVRFNTEVSPGLMGRGSKLRAIISPTTGLDHIDMEAAERAGIAVFHLRGQRQFLDTVSATAELAVGLMLALLRKIPQASGAVKEGAWDPGRFRGHEVAGKTLGIVGYGRLGTKVARAGAALDMRVIVHDPGVSSFPPEVEPRPSLDAVLTEADVLSLHVPLLPETTHLIDSRQLGLMRPGSVLINTSRGAIVSTPALLEALESGRLAGAAVDVLEDEPSVKERLHPLVAYARTHDNLLITPHIGGATYESVEKTDRFVLENYFRSLGGERADHR